MRQFILLFLLFNSLWDHTGIHSATTVEKKNVVDNSYADRKYNKKKIGIVIDKLNGVKIYYNGPISNVVGRNTTADGYNLGLKYQCIEFVKRYYYKYYKHKMPDSYGHAKDIFNRKLVGPEAYNKERNLMQYWNGGYTKPKLGDIFVFEGTRKNPYGHIGIVSMVSFNSVEMVQQNVGDHTRNLYELLNNNGKFSVVEPDLLGWLRKK